jgi:hypothetical protein
MGFHTEGAENTELFFPCVKSVKPKKVCFYFCENLQNFHKNKNKPLLPVAACGISNRLRNRDFTLPSIHLTTFNEN